MDRHRSAAGHDQGVDALEIVGDAVGLVRRATARPPGASMASR